MNKLMRLLSDLFKFVFQPPTTPIKATVVDKFYDHIPDIFTQRSDSSFGFASHDHNAIEVPALRVSLPGTVGTPRIHVPPTLFSRVEIGSQVEVRARPSRFFANTTRVSYAF